MTGVCVNLIPQRLIERRVRAHRIRRWVVACAVLFASVVAAWGVTATRSVENREELAAQLASARSVADERARLVAEAKSAHSAAARRLESARAVAGHPDWSVLLALLARARAEGLVLERVEVRPLAGSDAQARGDAEVPRRSDPSYQIGVRGVGESQSVVAQYLLALERVGLFESVRLRETRPRTIGARAVVEFGLDCAVSAGQRSKAGVSASAEKGSDR